MNTTLIYRVLIAIRGCWLVLEWFLGWGARFNVSLLHPYVSLIAGSVAVAFVLVILAGMWFFQRWARLIFVVLLGVALIRSPFLAHHYYSFSAPPSFVATISVFMLLLTGAIVAMSFLPPVRDHFAKNEA